LQEDFAQYLQQKAFKKVVLCNEAIDLVECTVLLRGPPNNSVKIGSGWKYFCSILRYQPGDVLRFKFAGRLTTNLIHVIKVEPDQVA
jgi:hypothetical protein